MGIWKSEEKTEEKTKEKQKKKQKKKAERKTEKKGRSDKEMLKMKFEKERKLSVEKCQSEKWK